MKRETFYFQIAVKEFVDNGANGVMIQGYASTPDLDRYKDIVEPGAFQKALTMYMKNPVVLRSHDQDRPVGSVTQARVTPAGLWVEANIIDEQTKTEIIDGRMRAFSIGYIPLASTLQHEDGSPFNAETDSVWDSNLVRVIKELDLVEISIVATPANGNALFSVSQSIKSYFNQLVTKSMHINKKEAEEAKADDLKTETPPAEAATEEAKTEETAVEEAKEAETEKKEETAAEGAENLEDEAAKTEAAAEVKAQDKAEKTGETPVAENGEGGEKPAEEPVAEAKTEAETPEEAKEGADGVLSVSEDEAKMMPLLKEAGLIQVKDAKAAMLPKAALNLIVKLTTMLNEQVERANNAEQKLANTPVKRALAVTGQFKEEAPEKSSKKEASAGFLSLFGINK